MTHRERIRNQRIMPPQKIRRFDPEPEVVATILWSFSGLERIVTTAVWWAGRDVFVRIKDARWKPEGVWLHADHVEPYDRPNRHNSSNHGTST